LGVAKDYWNNQVLTEQSFIQHEHLGRIYKTGDLGKWHEDGYVEYVGRIDSQVKVRGYRVELEEIERQLLGYPSLKQAIVAARNINQEQSLIAYFISDQDIDIGGIKNYLAAKLPYYMVPQFFMQIRDVPLTSNGKVARDKLPNPVYQSVSRVMLRNHFESKIHHIWSDILNLSKDQIGVSEDFFRLGGNSISAIKLVSRINKEFTSNTNILAIYNNSTIEKLAKHLEQSEMQLIIEDEGEI
jgi:fengycin family lipopeptide synthetase D